MMSNTRWAVTVVGSHVAVAAFVVLASSCKVSKSAPPEMCTEHKWVELVDRRYEDDGDEQIDTWESRLNRSFYLGYEIVGRTTVDGNPVLKLEQTRPCEED